MARDIEALFAAETELLGLKLLPAQEQSLRGAYAALREMVALVGADYPMEAEPAHVFVPDAGRGAPAMTAADPCFLTIAEAAALIAAKRLSPVELTRAYLDRIERLNGTLHAYVRVLHDEALAAARAAEAEIAAGHYRGPLHGIPIGLKDIYDTAGVPTEGGSKLCLGRIPASDATTTALLKEAGAIILGKLTTWEFAIGGTAFDTPFPPARNPWNIEHDPAGSSSGSGAAVAAGLCAVAMGSDTGGSIRWPAAWCGLAGLKPTYGRVSRAGIMPLSFSLDHAGPLTWTVEDAAIVLQAIAGHDPRDPASSDRAVPDYRAALARDRS